MIDMLYSNMKYFYKTIAILALILAPVFNSFVHAAGVFGETNVTFGPSPLNGQLGAQIFGDVVLTGGTTTNDIAVFVAVLDEPTDPEAYAGSYYVQFLDSTDFFASAFNRDIDTMDGATPFVSGEDYFFIFKLASLNNDFPPVYKTVTETFTEGGSEPGDGPGSGGDEPGDGPGSGGDEPGDGDEPGEEGPVDYQFSSIDNPLGEDFDIILFLQKLFGNLVKISIPFLVLFMIYTGFLFVSAHGDEKQLEQARTNFKYVIIGAALIFGSWTIAMALKGTVEDLEAPISFINSIINLV